MAKDMYQKRIERKQNKVNNTEVDNKTNINWFPGHMQKTKRLIKEKYNLIDVVYEVIDARIPFCSKINDLDELIKNKKRILIMNKSDLCDLNETKKWVKYYENLGYKVIMFNSKSDEDYKKLIDFTNDCFKEQSDKLKEKGLLQKEIRVLVVGIPNVGKSTLINKMAGKKACNVENKPGVTKNLSWIKTKSNILLLDTPGILWPKFENEKIALNLSAMGAIKETVLPLDSVAVYILNILNKYYKNNLTQNFGISSLSDDILYDYEVIGKRIGAFRNNEVDQDRVTNYIINEIKNEKIRGITFDRRD